ncbi:MAG: DUF4367 domain-containing protein [Theionarchaea archaeon]|nr:DUF4367 domain-containing protein [Theionarchaea archaeon]
MKIKWAVIGMIGIFLIVCAFLLITKRTPESSPAPCYTPSSLMISQNELTSIEKAQKHTLFKIIVPEYLPSGFAFLGVRVNEDKVTLIYEDSGGRRITLSEWKCTGKEYQPYPGEREVSISGIRGWVSIPGPYSLRWICSDVAVSLSADLSGGREEVMNEMIRIAESMQC